MTSLNSDSGCSITMAQLQVGLHIHLGMKWMDHPFTMSQFLIKNEAQIATIRSLGLTTVRFRPELSHRDLMPRVSARPTRLPDASEEDAKDAEDAEGAKSVDSAAMLSTILLAKQALIKKMHLRRQEGVRIEKAFLQTSDSVRDIEKTIHKNPKVVMQHATQLITKITESILSSPELAIQVMGDKLGGGELYFHSLNVTMLSMMMARALQLPEEIAEALATGTLLHDIGHKEVPDVVRMKTQPMNKAERSLYEMHCTYGATFGRTLGLAPLALTVIQEHHEAFDGTGYPKGLVGESAHLLSRIVAITNYYDYLCNPAVLTDALTPHEALSLMYTKLRSKFDPKLLQVFIRCLGAYPPGTLVLLSNGATGIVTGINAARPMRPMVVVYDADVPKDEAIVLDLVQETEINITKAMRLAQIPTEICSYLGLRKRVSYYFSASPDGVQPHTP